MQPHLAGGFFFASEEAHNLVQQVLRLRDGPIEASTVICEAPKHTVPRGKNVAQEVHATAPDPVYDQEWKDIRKQKVMRLTLKRVWEFGEH